MAVNSFAFALTLFTQYTAVVSLPVFVSPLNAVKRFTDLRVKAQSL
jgi:hypothetical protein